MGIIYTLFTIWVIGMLVFWGGLFALNALGGIVDAFRTKEVFVPAKMTPNMPILKGEVDDLAWKRAEMERDERAMDGEVELSELEQIMEDNDY